ncbi:MAG: DUF1697 domain-containing protein [Actinomycetota bacterium]
MKELRSLLEDLGHENVRTYLQRGNALFQSRYSASKRLAVEIEDTLSQAFDLKISVTLRSRPETGTCRLTHSDDHGSRKSA